MKGFAAALVLAAVVAEPWPSGPVPLEAGATRRFAVPREAHGAPARLVVDQKLLDVRLALRDGEGRVLAQVDTPRAGWGAEWLTLPQGDGPWVLELRALEDQAMGAPVLRIEYPVLSWEAAAAHAAAETALHRATAIVKSGDAEAAALDEARASAEDALARWTALDDPRGVALAQLALGRLHQEQGQAARAIRRYTETLAWVDSAGELDGRADLLNSIAVARFRLGEPEQARALMRRAAAIWEALDRTGPLGSVANNLGSLAWRQGDFSDALEWYARALAHRRAVGDRRGEARTINNIGTVHADLGEYLQALDHYRRSLAIRRETGDRRGEATSMNNIGTSYRRLGEPLHGRDWLDEALALRRALGDRHGEAATAVALAGALADLGELETAEGIAREALVLARELGARKVAADALQQLGAIALRLDRPAAARDHLEAALDAYREIGSRPGETATRIHLAEAARKAGEFAEAGATYAQALADARDRGQRMAMLEAAHGLAKLEAARGDDQDALASVRKAIGIAEAIRRALGADPLEVSFRDRLAELYELEVALLMRLHDTDPSAGLHIEALRAQQRGRSRQLALLAAASGYSPWDDAPVDLRERHRAARLVLRGVEAELALVVDAGDGDGTARAAREADAERLIRTLAELEGARRRLGPDGEPPAVPDLDALSAALAETDTRLMVYGFADARSWLWTVDGEGVAVHALAPRQEIDAAARWLRDLLAAGSQPRLVASKRLALERLGRLLLPADAAGGARRLVFLADGILAYLPLAALRPPGADEPLVEMAEIVAAPSLAAWLARPRPEERDNGPVVVFADPAYGSEGQAGMMPLRGAAAAWPALPASRREAEAVRRHAGAGTVLRLGVAASRDALHRADVRSARILHLAAHARLDGERPLLSSLVLATVDDLGRPVDGEMRLGEVYGLDLTAELVVLSACETAGGRLYRAEGVLGLTRAFLHAGARQVLSSLWRVEDESTARLMTEFYRRHLGEGRSAAAALRAAQRVLRRETGDDPTRWAAFQLHQTGAAPVR